ncbi:MAG: hypothetical protein IJ630_05490 [Treponema sp.]|nr:hypothetical protein [Treponema sp.]
MKKAGIMRIFFRNFFLSIIAGFFVSSCGLEEVITIEEPTVTNHYPSYEDSNYLVWYFDFLTEDNDNSSESRYLGTDIYYKIYSNTTNLTSQKSSILAVNTASNGSSASTRMIETYGYQPLGSSASTGNVVYVPAANSNRRVILRLKNYMDGDETIENYYEQNACVIIGGVLQSYIPYRYGNSKSFDFFDYDEDNTNGSRDVEPVDGDSDYYYNSTFTESDTYYVQLFAVGKAWNTDTCSASYSLVLDLGSVPIRKGE